MSYVSKATYKANTANIQNLLDSNGLVNRAELQKQLDDAADSVAWESQKTMATPFTYNCVNGNLQEMTLIGNGTLAITNAEAGKYYTLIKKGAFTLTLPTSEFSASGNIVPTGTALITFLFDGSDYYFSFSSYSGT